MRVPSDRAEEARGRMLALFPQGFEEDDVGGELELAVYVDSEGEARIRGSFDRVSANRVAPGWEDGWRRFHRSLRVGPLWIGPPWERAPGDAVAVVVEPGRAFGTGAHPTTRLALELLLDAPRGSLVDLGCGSGVLAIAAAKLGFAPVAGLDSDAVAVDVARANAAANGVTAEFAAADALAEELPRADVAVANIELGVVERLATRVQAATLITSGYLARDRPPHPGWRHDARAECEGWAADRFVRG